MRAGLFSAEASARRRQPQQVRARQAVDRIKEAFVSLVVAEGYANASTNRIAARAKLNIATLYRYFPNRQAIALALLEDASADLAQQVHEVLLDGLTRPLYEDLHRLISLLVEFLDREQVTMLRLLEEVPELRPSARALALENLSYKTGYLYIRQHFPDLDETSLRCKLFFTQRMGMGLLRSYVLEAPDDIPRQRFVAELAGLLVIYLEAPIQGAEQSAVNA